MVIVAWKRANAARSQPLVQFALVLGLTCGVGRWRSRMSVSASTIQQAVRQLRLRGQPIGVHSSLRSFGRVAGGAAAIIAGLLAEECTLLVPAFSFDAFLIQPPPGMRPPRNGWRYDGAPTSVADRARVSLRGLVRRWRSFSVTRSLRGVAYAYTPNSVELDRNMGAIPAAVVRAPGRVRGSHPLCSFAGVGPEAARFIGGQTPYDVYAPLRALAAADGFVVCMGVGLTRMTLLHLAEQQAGRALFRRWAYGPKGRPMAVEVGGCSEGFGRFDAVLAPIERATMVGASRWRVFPAAAALHLATDAIRADPAITHCADPTCDRCNDGVAGGPLSTTIAGHVQRQEANERRIGTRR
jgi:aminoglycoside 3-N-acetyltransferase